MPLKAKKPDPAKKRFKAFVFATWGAGKTTAIMQFPSSVIIDTEKGTENYDKTINKAGSVVLKTSNAEEIKDEIRTLLLEKHPYKTLSIDPITEVRKSIEEKWLRIFDKYAKTEKEAEMQDYGMRYWGKVNSEYRSILRLCKQLDMNVILSAHQKDIYDGMVKTGVGPDAGKNDGHMFDYIFQVKIENGKLVAKTIKERSEIGEAKFPMEFEWSYANFCKYYGKDEIEKESAPIQLASSEQVAEVEKLLSIVKVEDDWERKVLDKADVDNWRDLTVEQIAKTIDYLTKKKEGK